MGTRRSRHNKGRKPVYKDYRTVAAHLIANPAYVNGGWYSTRTNWSDHDRFKLGILSDAGAALEASADALGRAPTTLVHKARELKLVLPREWSNAIAIKRPKRHREPPTSLLAYPYITRVRDEHSLVLEINDLVPKAIADSMRGDICQEILVAVLEGRTTVADLRARQGTPSYYIRKFWKENFEDAGRAIYFQGREDEDRSYDEVASSIAVKEWYHEQLVERHRYMAAAPKCYTPPVQFEAAWRDQVGRVTMGLHELGQYLSFDEVEEMLEAASNEDTA